MSPVTPTPNAPLPKPLPKPLRTQLENTVKAARDVAEKAGKAALAQLAVAEPKVPDYLDEPQRILRRKLRAHARAISASSSQNNSVELQALVWEVAYEHWHRMLFARFLAENNLLMWEPGAAVSLDDCRDMVDNHPDMAMGAKSHWELAGKLAARMLPQVFKPHSPVFEISFAPEHQRELERLLSSLPPEVFYASDSLGWVYQFWQAKRKDEVNASEVKIGADELPAVTQLFTEPYMVDFLLHNSLGAWWHTRHPGQSCPVAMPYLRTLEDGSPAAGNFDGWPDHLTDFKLLDPSCGSGHFLVAAFLLLVPLRMADEGLSAMDAVDAVLAHNLHGLEIDLRCVEIAVFALALAAWRYPDEDGNPLGVRQDMPAPRIACCGLRVSARPEDWEALVPDDLPNDLSGTLPKAALLRQELRLLHSVFAQAPLLGSLLNPSLSIKNDLATSSFETLQTLLEQALSSEQPGTLWGSAQDLNDDAWDLAISARGLLEAARLLDARYHLVVTNVPYLSVRKQSDTLRAYSAAHYPDAKNDLANVFLERCLELARDQGEGVVQIVMPQNWLFLTSYKKQRESLLKRVQWNLLARLGPGAFETISGEVVQAVLLTQTHATATAEFQLRGMDASAFTTVHEKATELLNGPLVSVEQKGQLSNPDSRIALGEGSEHDLLLKYAVGLAGILNGDSPRFLKVFWEMLNRKDQWSFQQTTQVETSNFGGLHNIVLYDEEEGHLREEEWIRRERLHNSDQRGQSVVGKLGIAVSSMGKLPVSRFLGSRFDSNVAAVVPRDPTHLPAIWCFCSSPNYNEAVRRIDQKLNVTNATLVKVPFDLAHWQQIAAERYPNGLPKPYSDDPTQWLFHGHPQPATDPLQVAVARLLGYRWPAEQQTVQAQELQDKSASSADPTSAISYQHNSNNAATADTSAPAVELSSEAHAWIACCQPLAKHTDDDGIVCLPAVRGEQPADQRLLALLIDAWETVAPGSWSPSVLDKLLAQADCAGKSLSVWLRDHFFEQHAKRFGHRPFIWHVWDGQKDGFGALVNAHKLDAKNLERLIHTYLGDWIRTQEAGVASGADGAPLRLSAAQNLKARLQAILEGEKPYDIFVRWKPLHEQPIGWQPDPNDGIRLNIHPFMTAEVLRVNKKPKLNITWDKDRGKDVESAPWFKVFNGERINDHHLTLAEKIAAAKETKK
ncbi:MAG: restriction endonuclease subunit M [Comamonadaceae bacterium CG12_big_fil_rev_8_21_14_0_65_59_15]|nr:MAG: restriction endonuclease subunit M [Comamonadaceae bacterium CG12_big_fil_rev_8_21_14_0_65_59_15]